MCAGIITHIYLVLFRVNFSILTGILILYVERVLARSLNDRRLLLS
jgi:hypothetical protein